MRFYSLPLVLFLVLHIVVSTPLHACSCVGDTDIKDAVKHANWVVTGQVVAIETVTENVEMVEGVSGTSILIYYHKVTLIVDTVFKGKRRKKKLVIHTGAGSGDCGFPFQLKESYIVYVTSIASPFVRSENSPEAFKGSIWTDICTRTRVWEEQEVRVLEKLCGYKKRQK